MQTPCHLILVYYINRNTSEAISNNSCRYFVRVSAIPSQITPAPDVTPTRTRHTYGRISKGQTSIQVSELGAMIVSKRNYN